MISSSSAWYGKTHVPAYMQYHSQYKGPTVNGGQYLEAMVSPPLNRIGGTVRDSKSLQAGSSLSLNVNHATPTKHNRNNYYGNNDIYATNSAITEGHNVGKGVPSMPATRLPEALYPATALHDQGKVPSQSNDNLYMNNSTARNQLNMISDGVTAFPRDGASYGVRWHIQQPMGTASRVGTDTLTDVIPKKDHPNPNILNNGEITTLSKTHEEREVTENEDRQKTLTGNQRRRHHRRHHHRHKEKYPSQQNHPSHLPNERCEEAISNICHKPVYSQGYQVPLPHPPTMLHISYGTKIPPSEYRNDPNLTASARKVYNDNIIEGHRVPPPHHHIPYLSSIPPPPGGWNAFYEAAKNGNITPRPTGPQESTRMRPEGIDSHPSCQNAFYPPHHQHPLHTPVGEQHPQQQSGTHNYENGYLRYKREIGQLQATSLISDKRGNNQRCHNLEDDLGSSRSSSYTSSWSSYSTLVDTPSLSSLSEVTEDYSSQKEQNTDRGDDGKRYRREQEIHTLRVPSKLQNQKARKRTEGDDISHRDRKLKNMSSVSSIPNTPTLHSTSSVNAPSISNQPPMANPTSSYSNMSSKQPRNPQRSQSQIEESRMRQIALRALQKGVDFKIATKEPPEEVMLDRIITPSGSTETIREQDIIRKDYRNVNGVRSSSSAQPGADKGYRVTANPTSLYPSGNSTANGSAPSRNTNKNESRYKRSTVSSSLNTTKISGRNTPIRKWGVNAKVEPTTRASHQQKVGSLYRTSSAAHKPSMNCVQSNRTSSAAHKPSMNCVQGNRTSLQQNKNYAKKTENFLKSQQQHSYLDPEHLNDPPEHRTTDAKAESPYSPSTKANATTLGCLENRVPNDNYNQMRQIENVQKNSNKSPTKEPRNGHVPSKAAVIQNAAAALAMVNGELEEDSQWYPSIMEDTVIRQGHASPKRSPMAKLGRTICHSSHADKLREELRILEEGWNQLSVIQAKARVNGGDSFYAPISASAAAAIEDKCISSPKSPQVFNMKDADHNNKALFQFGSPDGESPPANIPVGCRPNVIRADHTNIGSRVVQEDHDAILRLIRKQKELRNINARQY